MLMARLVSRGEIVDVLQRWQAGILTAEHVHAWANEAYVPGAMEFDDYEDDDNSVALEVLASLDMLDLNFTVVDDVPIYLEFLGTPKGRFAEGYRQFQQAMAAINVEERQAQL